MWKDVLVLTGAVLLVVVGGLIARQVLRMRELARDDLADARRLAADDTVQIDLVEPEDVITTDDVSKRRPRLMRSRVPRTAGNDTAEISSGKALAGQVMAVVRGEWEEPVDERTQVVAVIAPVTVAPAAEPPPRERRLVSVEDELGTWDPTAYQQATPLILGQVLTWRKWKTVRPEDVGLSA